MDLKRFVDRLKLLYSTPAQTLGSSLTYIFNNKKPANSPRLINSDAIDALAYLYSIVYACIDKRAQSVSGGVWQLRDSKGELIEHDNNIGKALYALLENPWDIFSGDDLLYISQAYIDACGEVFIFIERGARNEPIGLAPLRPDKMQIKTNADGTIAYYEMVGDSVTRYEPEEIIHIKRVNLLNLMRGQSLIRAAGYEIAENKDMHESRLGLLANDSTPPYALVPTDGQKISQAQADALREQIEQRQTGTRMRSKVLVLSGAVEPRSLPVNHAELFYLSEIGATEASIARMFGVPMAILGDVTDFNRANADAAQAIFLQRTILPEVKRIEASLAAKLLPLFGLTSYTLELYIEIPRDKVYDLDLATKTVASGILTRNEARDVLGFEPIEIPEADSLYVPALSIPAFSQPPKAMKTKGFDPDRLESYARTVERKQRAFERSVKRLVDSYFDQQSKYVRSQLSKMYRAKAEGTPTKVEVDDIFDELTEGIRLAKLLSPEMLSIMESFFYDTLGFSQERIDAVFSPELPGATAWLGDTFTDRCVSVNHTTKLAIQQQLDEGVALGEGIDKLSKRIADSMNEMKSYRSDRIAQTEVISASNAGSYDGMKIMGVERKQWVSGYDDKVRDSHKPEPIGCGGQIRMLDEPFNLAGGNLMYPGDFSCGAPEEVINCRCTFVPYYEDL